MTCLPEVRRKSRGIASLTRLQLVSLAMVMFHAVTFLYMMDHAIEYSRDIRCGRYFKAIVL